MIFPDRHRRSLSWLAAFLFLACGFFSCKTNTESDPADAPGTLAADSSTEALYPFLPFISAELAYLDSVPLLITKKETINGRATDSSILNANEVRSYAALFSAIDPNHASLRPFYHEESFVDMTLGYNTFIISTDDKALPLQSATVLLHPETNDAERLIMQTIARDSSGQLIRRQMTWRRHKGIQIVDQQPGKGDEPIVHTTQIYWSD